MLGTFVNPFGSEKGTKVMNCDEGAYFFSHAYDPLLKSNADEEITLKKSVAHDGQNCQVSVIFT